MGVTWPLIATYDLTFARRAREIVGLQVALVFAWHFLPRDFPPRAAGKAEESLGILARITKLGGCFNVDRLRTIDRKCTKSIVDESSWKVGDLRLTRSASSKLAKFHGISHVSLKRT